MATTNNGMPGSNQVTHYEGTEKLFEIWFKESGNGDLRTVPRFVWEDMLKLVNAEIISEMHDDSQCAYILSESSMFVAKRRFILKTCGTTTLLNCIDTLLRIAKKHCTFTVVEDVFYSRKNFIRPELQASTYQKFEDEVKILESHFPDGAAYVLGRLNGDCWYLFTLPVEDNMKADQTLEVLMTDLDEDVMALFHKTNKTATEVTKVSGISDLLPGCSIDATLFDPCGYSMNGLLRNEEYATIHITPEKDWSYVSFETNVEMPCYDNLVRSILETFKPGKFVMTVFANKVAKCVSSYHALRESFHDGYIRQDRQFSQFKSYDLTFGNYVKEKSFGVQR
ncbi:S-adenosylmethionine decarboxylase proenzyme-like [Antedon mediterranea]|uniref:S-adenosylmethionine decarboxylase proenzyme-like n=1 Tax=Antedon mediterranea TaxID=105859 RepID=UPI003AF4D0E6